MKDYIEFMYGAIMAPSIFLIFYKYIINMIKDLNIFYCNSKFLAPNGEKGRRLYYA